MLFGFQAKFLFMVRDGRATVNSIISRKVTITGFDLTSYRQCMSKWNHAIETMHVQCKEIGSDKCMLVNNHFVISSDWFTWYLKLTFFFCSCACLSKGVLRATGITSRAMDAKNIEILGHSVEWIGIASWRVH